MDNLKISELFCPISEKSKKSKSLIDYFSLLKYLGRTKLQQKATVSFFLLSSYKFPPVNFLDLALLELVETSEKMKTPAKRKDSESDSEEFSLDYDDINVPQSQLKKLFGNSI